MDDALQSEFENDLADMFTRCGGLDIRQVPASADVISLGVDSLSMMRLASQWRRKGLSITFADLISSPRLGDWRRLVAERLPSSSPVSPPQSEPAPPDVEPEDAPFELALMQHAYWIGRRSEQHLGGVNAHFYHEFDSDDIDLDRLETAINKLLQRHAMLRVRVDDDGVQRIAAKPHWQGLRCHDLRIGSANERSLRLDQLRQQLSQRRMDVSCGEVFDVQASLLPEGRCRLHFNLDMMAADALSLRILLSDLAMLYRGEQEQLLPLDYSYRRYLRARCHHRESREYQNARHYWQSRLPELPGAPQLPTLSQPRQVAQAVVRRHHWFDRGQRERMELAARCHGLTPAMVFAAAYAETLGAWSQNADFLLNLPLFNRQPLHPHVDSLVGDFTSSILLAWQGSMPGSFVERAHRLQQRFHSDVAYADYSGVDVLRDLSREQGQQVYAPVVFTSALGLGELFSQHVQTTFGNPIWMVSQGPQVWLDVQLTEFNGGYLFNWDAREAAFPPGMLDDMFSGCIRLLNALLENDAAWERQPPAMLSADAQQVRRQRNATQKVFPEQSLHHAFFSLAQQQPDAPALLWAQDGMMRYGELAEAALCLATLLRQQGVMPGDLVAVTLPKGPQQIIAVLGILAAGGAWVPIGLDQPAQRRERIHRTAGVRWVIAETASLDSHVQVIRLGDAQDCAPSVPYEAATPDTTAYIIFTSGSTGEPKGVDIPHGAVVNTVMDINQRCQLGHQDRLLAVSALDFDLSVYDIFGPLSAGGAMVLIDEDTRRDAAHWLKLMQRHHVTLWNSVPVLLEMLLAAVIPGTPPLEALRCVLLSGDWIPLDLPTRLRAVAPDSRVIAMGGATEAAIWSNAFEVVDVDPRWRSIPYGYPLANQCYRVIDALQRDCPDWAIGELWIGGKGLARGYRGNDIQTREHFVTVAGERWYRTGDLGRYWPDGTLEFIGRLDQQVKVRGHRIELGEVEAALNALPQIQQSVALVTTAGKLAAVVVSNASSNSDLKAALKTRLAREMIPDTIVCTDALPLNRNGKIDRKALLKWVDAQVLATQVAESIPLSKDEERVADVWRSVLGQADIRREDNFFALGGDSLQATRVISRLRQAGFVDASLAQLFSAPELADFCAQLAPQQSLQSPSHHWDSQLDRRYQPFELTDVQQAYLLGRQSSFALGGVGCHFYREFLLPELDVPRLEQAVNLLVQRHDMLRAVFDDSGLQRVLPDVPHFGVDIIDSPQQLRERYAEQVFSPTQWPLFSVAVAREDNGWRLAIGQDNLIADALSVMIFYRELNALYQNPQAVLPPLSITFRDYLHNAQPSAETLASAWQYWRERLAQLPVAPQLPLQIAPETLENVHFKRRAFHVGASQWHLLQSQCQQHGITPSALLLTAFCHVLERWTGSSSFTLNLTLFDRKELHPQVNDLMGDFTSLMLIPYHSQAGEAWTDKVQRIQGELWRSLDQRAVSGVRVLRELARQRNDPTMTMPVVFTSALGVGSDEPPTDGSIFDAPVWGLSQTPQVWLDFQATHRGEGIELVWDAVEALFPAGLIDAMFSGYQSLLDQLCRHSWQQPVRDVLPLDQQQSRHRVNDTAAALPQQLLHHAFFTLSEQQPTLPALLWQDHQLSYGELAVAARRVAALLQTRGVVAGQLVAVTLPKGPQQIVAVLGVLAAGAAWVPIGLEQPPARRATIHQRADVHWVLTDDTPLAGIADGITIMRMSEAESMAPLAPSFAASLHDTAYIIFTSGSTGEPKGVDISHGAVVNTVMDINRRCALSAQDRLLAVSALDFDLSVYDIFGPLSSGGAMVLIDEASRRDATAWCDALTRHKVTVWNSVPVLLEMLLAALPSSQKLETLRTVLLSGDWIPLTLPAQLQRVAPGCRLIAMGGATEAAIWSNAFEVDEVPDHWHSIPYGYPLTDQRYRVVDTQGRDCPDWVTGELWIGGAGLARGYRNDPQRTAERFVIVDGERWYRTGDLGRYWADGTLEFLGRLDQQIKLRGHRIEIGEIEAALTHLPGVGQSVVAVVDQGATQHLMAGVVPPVSTMAADRVISTAMHEPQWIADDPEALIVEVVLIELLGLATSDEAGLKCTLAIDDHYQPLVTRWLTWLQERQLITVRDGQLYAGLRLPTLPDVSTVQASLHSPRWIALLDRLWQRRDDYRAILSGELDARILLDDEYLSPESLIGSDPNFQALLDEWANALSQRITASKRPVRIAELGGRGGQVAQALIARLPDASYHYHLLDESSTLVAMAEQRLHKASCFTAETFSSDWIPETLRYQFDIVLCANALHRYTHVTQGVMVASQLLCRGGELRVAEPSTLSPLALMTAAVLEQGYPQLEPLRQRRNSPLLNAAQWLSVFGDAGLIERQYHMQGDSVLMSLSAQRPHDAIDLISTTLLHQLATYLPSAMLPERIEVLPMLPLNRNGKVDRAWLQQRFTDHSASISAHESPQSATECALAELWCELLSLTDVGRQQSFFELGGDSLMATRFLAQVQQRFGVTLSMREVFNQSRLDQLAIQIDRLLDAQLDTADMEEGAL